MLIKIWSTITQSKSIFDIKHMADNNKDYWGCLVGPVSLIIYCGLSILLGSFLFRACGGW